MTHEIRVFVFRSHFPSFVVGLLSIFCALSVLDTRANADDRLIDQYRAAATSKWEEDIRELERLDQQQADPEQAILFIGSSSIRLWESMAEGLAPWPTIRRGYGGAKLSDLLVFVDRLVQPHRFEALAIFVANDITGGDEDKTPEQVLELYQAIVARVRVSHPEQPILFIAITPSSSRFAVWPEIRRANHLIENWSRSQANLHFVATADRFLTDKGQPNDALFRDDRLHLNAAGYAIWSELIKAALARILNEPSKEE